MAVGRSRQRRFALLRSYCERERQDDPRFAAGDVMLSKEMAEIPLGHLILGNIGGSEYP